MASGRYVPISVGNSNDVTTINQNYDNIATATDNLLSRQPGDTPNAMNVDLDMNGYNIINQGNPVTLTSFNPRGTWQAATAYAEGDEVFYNTSSYLCVTANTSSSAFITDLLAGKWTYVALGTVYQGNWSGPGTGYFLGDIVFVSPDSLYQCIANNVSSASFSNDFNAGKWEIYLGSLGTMSTQNANAVAITGGNISATTLATNTITNGTMTGTALNGVSIAASAITTGSINGTVIGNSAPAAATFVTASDNGAAPTTTAQLTNKAYVDGTTVTNGSGTGFRLPGGLIIQGGQSTSSATITFPIPFTTAVYAVNAIHTGADSTINFIVPASTTTLTTMIALTPTGGGLGCSWFAMGK